MKPISYSIIQYHHDRALGEALNVGVLAFEPEEGVAALEYERNSGWLSDRYEAFDRRGYRLAFERFANGLKRVGAGSDEALFHIHDSRIRSSQDIVKRVWPDVGLSFGLSPVRYTVASDLRSEAKSLFKRYIVGAGREEVNPKRRDDRELWADIVRKSDRFEGLASMLHQEKIGPQKVELDYVGRSPSSRKFFAIEPVSLDYQDASKIMDRAYGLAGRVLDLESVDEFEALYVVLGEPRRQPGLQKSSKEVTRILGRFEKVQVFEESRVNMALKKVSELLGGLEPFFK